MKTDTQAIESFLTDTRCTPLQSELLEQVEKRLGILPNFFLADSHTPEIITRQWELTLFSYLDNPLPSLFKERLFVYLSSFCKVKHCLVRHVGFLNGLGYPSGDCYCPTQSIEEIIRLLEFRLPCDQQLEPYLAICHAHASPLAVLPEADTKMENAIFACAAHIFLLTPDAAKSCTALQQILDPVCFNYLTLLLSFIRTTHYWMELQPQLPFDEDVQALMSTNDELAGYLLKEPDLHNSAVSHKLLDELGMLRETSHRFENLSQEYESLLQQHKMLRKKEQEQQAALKAVEELKQQARLLELIHDPVIVWNLSGTIAVWNAGAENLYGYTKEEALGQHIHHLLKTKHAPSSLVEIFQILKNKGEWTGELSHMAKNGEQMVVESRKKRYDLNGQQFVLETIHDITEKKVAEEALRKSEERLQLAASVTGFGIHDYNEKDHHLYYSPELNSIFGIPADQEVGFRSVIKYVHPDDRRLVLQNRRDAINLPQSVGSIEQRFRILRPDNEIRWVYNRSRFTFSDENGVRTPVRNTGIIVDITEGKKAEERLRESEEKYRTLFESIDEGFCIIEVFFDEAGQPVDYQFLDVNPAFERQTGIENAVGKRMREIDPKLEAYWFQTYGRVALTGEPLRFENRAEQLHRFFDVYAFKVGDPHEHKVAVLVTDITKRKALEKKQEEFIGIASHELKTPVTSIKAYTEVLQDIFEETNENQSIKLIQKLDAQVDRLTDLIRSLLDTTKISEGHLALHLEEFSLENLVMEKIDDLQRLSAKHRINWKPADEVWVNADRERIGQVLTNLISNAIKYSPNGGDVTICCKVVKRQITICIQDKGIGIPAEMQSKVFDRFYRVQYPGIPAFQGMGLGLYITAGIIQQHGGTVQVQSKIGEGSTFSFTIPQITNSKNDKYEADYCSS